MVMAGNGGERAAWGGGFAARASRQDEGAASAGKREHPPIRREERAAPNTPPRTAAAPRTAAPPRENGMRRVKRLATVAAVSVALAMTSLAYGAWTSAVARADVEHATAGAVPTLVATADIHAGDALSSALVETQDVPASYRSAGALGAEALTADGAPAGGRALVDIPAGTQIAAAFVAGMDGADRLSSALAAGKEAVTLAVDVETGLAGRVRPYDTVRIVSAEGASSGEAFLETVCARARVLAVGDDASGAQSASASVTVEVLPEEADAVREAQYAGRVSLVLVAATDALDEGEPDGQVD